MEPLKSLFWLGITTAPNLAAYKQANLSLHTCTVIRISAVIAIDITFIGVAKPITVVRYI